MEPDFMREAFPDEWVKPVGTPAQIKMRRTGWPFYYFRKPLPIEPYIFTNYLLAYRCEASKRELKLIESNNLFEQTFIQIRPEDRPVTFAEALSPNWIPEVNPSQLILMQTEARIRSICLTWTHFFESMPG